MLFHYVAAFSAKPPVFVPQDKKSTIVFHFVAFKRLAGK